MTDRTEGSTTRSDGTEVICYSRTTRTLYLEVCKAACSSIKAALLTADGVEIKNDGFVHSNFYFADHSRMTLHPRHVFTFVRDPLDRLLSAFRQKIRTGLGKRLNCPLEKNATADEWVVWVTSQPPDIANKHWRPQTIVINNQAERWGRPQFIGKFESLDRDWKRLQQKTGLPDLPHLNPTPREPMELSQPSTEAVQRYYAADYERFGYEFTLPESVECGDTVGDDGISSNAPARSL